MKLKYLTVLLTSFCFLYGASSPCELPAQFKGKIDTFIINPNLSCGSNIFINTLPLIGVQAQKKLPKKQQGNLLVVARQAYEELANTFAQRKISLNVEELKIPNKHKGNINIRHYKGNTEKVILYIHGGGWSRGSLDTHDALCREISYRTGYSVFAVDYRLAPENIFPAGLEDVETAYDWLVSQYSESKILLSGDSAGGNLAMAMTVKYLQEGKKKPNGLLLLYPALDLRVPEKTTDPMADGYFLTRARTNDFIKGYLGKDFKEVSNQITASPLLAPEEILKKLPPVLLIASEYDPLTASSKEFTEKAKNAGADVDLKVIENTIHIFAQFPDLFTEANEALELLAQKAKEF